MFFLVSLLPIISYANDSKITYCAFFTVGANRKKVGTFSVGVFGDYDKKVSRNLQIMVNCTKGGLCYKDSKIKIEENGRRITFGDEYIENSTYLLPYKPKQKFLKHIRPFYVSFVNSYAEYIGSKVAIDLERRVDRDNLDFIFGKVVMGERLLKQMQMKPDKNYYIMQARIMPNDADIYEIL